MTTDDSTTALGDTVADPVDTDHSTARVPRASDPALATYQIGHVLGRGGMGEVVAAQDRRIEREVAIKRMRQTNPDPEAIARFVREAKIQARLDHPAIVPVHELGTDEAGLPFFTMKRLAGTTLAKRLDDKAPIQPLLRAFVDVCFAIQLAHERGVVHRDLKPSNIMLGNYGDVYVLDWGIAHVIGSDDASSSMHLPLDTLPPTDTATGAMLGTPGYMAPEQMRGETIGPPADLYALGAILFEILAGEPLHPPGHPAVASTLAGGSGSPAARRPERAIAPELDRACSDALAEDPAARPTARALAERIQRYLDGDRDLEHRKQLAAEHVTAARAALAAGQRSDAIYRAGRALALEPESVEAAAIVTKLIVEPPDRIPEEAERSLEAEERRLDMIRSRRGTIAYSMIWVVIPFIPFIPVQSWVALGLLLATASGMGVLAWINGRTGKVPLWALLTGSFALVTAFSRLAGPFILTPLLACGVTMSLGSHRSNRPWLATAWLALATAMPFLLDLTGVMGTTWRMTDAGLLTAGTIFRGSAFAMIFGTFALTLVVGLYTLSITRARYLAQRESHLQAWHLKQLLPETRR